MHSPEYEGYRDGATIPVWVTPDLSYVELYKFEKPTHKIEAYQIAMLLIPTLLGCLFPAIGYLRKPKYRPNPVVQDGKFSTTFKTIISIIILTPLLLIVGLKTGSGWFAVYVIALILGGIALVVAICRRNPQ